MSDPLKDTPEAPPALHEGKTYELSIDGKFHEDGGGWACVACEGEAVLRDVYLETSELAPFRRLVHCRNIVDGPDFDGGPDDKLGQAISLLCEDIDERLAQRLSSRVSALLSERLGVAVEGEDAAELIALVREEIARWYEPESEEGEAHVCRDAGMVPDGGAA
jgi:hypothetical protein